MQSRQKKETQHTNPHLFWCSPIPVALSHRLAICLQLGEWALGGEGQKLARSPSPSLGKEKYIGRIKTPETRFIMAALPSHPPYFSGEKREERVEWHGEYQHQMLLFLRLLQREREQHNDGYLIDNLPPSDSSEMGSSPNGNFAAFACVTVHLLRRGG